MGSIAEGERNKMLDALVGRGAYSANAAFYVKLHTGDPGAAGTNNAATETTRQAVTVESTQSGFEAVTQARFIAIQQGA